MLKFYFGKNNVKKRGLIIDLFKEHIFIFYQLSGELPV